MASGLEVGGWGFSRGFDGTFSFHLHVFIIFFCLYMSSIMFFIHLFAILRFHSCLFSVFGFFRYPFLWFADFSRILIFSPNFYMSFGYFSLYISSLLSVIMCILYVFLFPYFFQFAYFVWFASSIAFPVCKFIHLWVLLIFFLIFYWIFPSFLCVELCFYLPLSGLFFPLTIIVYPLSLVNIERKFFQIYYSIFYLIIFLLPVYFFVYHIFYSIHVCKLHIPLTFLHRTCRLFTYFYIFLCFFFYYKIWFLYTIYNVCVCRITRLHCSVVYSVYVNGHVFGRFKKKIFYHFFFAKN